MWHKSWLLDQYLFSSLQMLQLNAFFFKKKEYNLYKTQHYYDDVLSKIVSNLKFLKIQLPADELLGMHEATEQPRDCSEKHRFCIGFQFISKQNTIHKGNKK